MHGCENANVHQLQRNRNSRARDRGFQPGHLLVAGDEDAADALCEGLQDRPDVAVAIEHGDAEGLENGTAPGHGGGGLPGGVDGVMEAEELEGKDGD